MTDEMTGELLNTAKRNLITMRDDLSNVIQDIIDIETRTPPDNREAFEALNTIDKAFMGCQDEKNNPRRIGEDMTPRYLSEALEEIERLKAEIARLTDLLEYGG